MSSRPQHERYDAFVITAPGLEPLALAELNALGASDARVTDGGVSFAATRKTLYESNLHLRTASRVVVRASEFGAKAFHELERRAGKVPWEAFIAPNLAVSIRVTCRKSRLYHSDAVAERVAAAIASRVPGIRPVSDSPESGPDMATGSDPDADGQLVLVRLLYDRCTISIDSSGALLHLRGYRQDIAKAPMRETLAAAAVMASGWTGAVPLMDPMCGSGTIPIEGALIARRIPPGLYRHFAFEHWPDFDRGLWGDVTAAARDRVLARAPASIQGSDRDAGAIEAAIANARRAGVADDIEFSRRPVSAVAPPHESGFVISNPPYGVRVGEADRLRNLYAQLGNVLRAKCPEWNVALVSADAALERQVRIPLEPILRTTNGGIKVRVVTGMVPAHRDEPGSEKSPGTAAAQRYPS
jgi:putative N6-adenine-specific DNA methylase